MSAFYVGQRVRIVADYDGTTAVRVGTEAVVSDVGPVRGESGRLYDWGLYVPDYGTVVVDSDEIEPIVDDGRQVISWADMADLWTPEQVTA
jgi:hypothetical protein